MQGGVRKGDSSRKQQSFNFITELLWMSDLFRFLYGTLGVPYALE